jgi:kynureninase
MFSGVQYYTGQFFDLEAITKAGHAQGANVGFDLAHAAGNLPLQLHDSGADFACWCGYKYLNGGPGTLSGCFVHERHLDRDDVIKLAGWWSNDVSTRFEMREQIDWAKGADAWQISNPPILSTAPLLTALDIHNRAGMQALRDKAIALTGFLEQGLLALVGEHIEIITPDDPHKRGCQLSVRMLAGKDSGHQLYQSLYDRGHICDWRNPDIMRIAPVPLYNSFSDVHRLLDCMQDLLAHQS